MKDIDTIQHILNDIYGTKTGNLAFEKIAALIERFPVKKGPAEDYFSEEDVFLITYGDTLNKKGELPVEAPPFYAVKRIIIGNFQSTITQFLIFISITEP